MIKTMCKFNAFIELKCNITFTNILILLECNVYGPIPVGIDLVFQVNFLTPKESILRLIDLRSTS